MGEASEQTSDLAPLMAALGHRFFDPGRLTTALTHPSVGGDPGQASLPNYERLEFLGDRVLGLVVAERLLERFPDEAEGEIAKRHAALVSRDILAELAAQLDLGRYLRLASGARADGVAEQPGILADTLEALIAALYLDGGIEVASAFVRRHWSGAIEADIKPPRDAKSRLQEWAMAHGLALPTYEEVAREGPAHDPVFTMAVVIEGGRRSEGRGGSKRTAEQAAAQRLLATLESGGD